MASTVSPETANPYFRAELLTRLGLPPNAGPGHIEAAFRAALSVLDRLPTEQQPWAEGQRAELTAIRSLLLEAMPGTSKSPSAAARSHAETATASTGQVAMLMPQDIVDASRSGWNNRRRMVVVAIGAAVILILGVIGFALTSSPSVPGITGTPTNTSNPSASASLDMARVAALMQKIAANPKDVTSLMGLADAYFQAGDYQNSEHFSQEATVVAPKNDSAWVALGAAQFNGGQTAASAISWQKAIVINPKNAEAHYDLGFYYLSGSSPSMAKVKAEWEAVVAIDPTSALAKNVKTHLASLAKATPTPSPASS